MRIRKGLGGLFTALGILLITGSIGLLLYNRVTAEKADQAAEAVMTVLAERIETRAQEKEPESESKPKQESIAVEEAKAMETIEIDGIAYIGYLTIPSLELDLPVMSEWSYEGLATAPGRYSGDLSTHDLVIAAHNYTRHFGSLHKLSIGDEIIFTDVNAHQYHFAVEDLEILAPDAVEAMTAGAYPLSLFTCTYDGRTRLTVRCTEKDLSF